MISHEREERFARDTIMFSHGSSSNSSINFLEIAGDVRQLG